MNFFPCQFDIARNTHTQIQIKSHTHTCVYIGKHERIDLRAHNRARREKEKKERHVLWPFTSWHQYTELPLPLVLVRLRNSWHICGTHLHWTHLYVGLELRLLAVYVL